MFYFHFMKETPYFVWATVFFNEIWNLPTSIERSEQMQIFTAFAHSLNGNVLVLKISYRMNFFLDLKYNSWVIIIRVSYFWTFQQFVRPIVSYFLKGIFSDFGLYEK